MKKIVVALSCMMCLSSSFGQDIPPVSEITKEIIHSVKGYANAISCAGVEVEPKMIAALVPYKTVDDSPRRAE